MSSGLISTGSSTQGRMLLLKSAQRKSREFFVQKFAVNVSSVVRVFSRWMSGGANRSKASSSRRRQREMSLVCKRVHRIWMTSVSHANGYVFHPEPCRVQELGACE
jgi:hypothetical protein